MIKNNYNRIMKRILLCVICILGLIFSVTNSIAQVKQEKTPIIPKDTFIKAITPVEISSELSDIGDEVVFINTSDMYINDLNVLPRGSKMYGFIEDIREHVQGTNASIKIKISKILMADKRTLNVDAYVFSENDNYLGGEITPPTYYHRMPHYINGWNQGVLQYRPSNIREIGQHHILKAGSEVIIILNEDLKIL